MGPRAEGHFLASEEIVRLGVVGDTQDGLTQCFVFGFEAQRLRCLDVEDVRVNLRAVRGQNKVRSARAGAVGEKCDYRLEISDAGQGELFGLDSENEILFSLRA